MEFCDVAIIGAGPYGLSLAAHLRERKVGFRIFGTPMEFWSRHMPEGMYLKSEGFASSLYHPHSKLTLKDYCAEHREQYADTGSPVPLRVFSSYGLEFKRRFVPNVEDQKLTSLERSPNGFQLTFDNGEVAGARRVVIAVGLTYYAHVPPELSDLPSGLLTHSSSHSKLNSFKGREVIIVGAGSSATDLAALLYQAGANVQVVARDTSIRFQDPPEDSRPSLFRRLRAPLTGIGRGWILYMCAKMPIIFRLMPEDFRIEKVRKILGPAPCWFTREQIVGKVPLNVGVTITEATVQDGRASLRLVDRVGNERFIGADHVIAATGYRPDVSRLSFLDAGLLSDIRRVGNSPALSSNFESTVDNLYFVGVSAANTFGPLLRFAYGAGFAAPRLSKHLAKTAFRNSTKQYTQSRTDALIQSEQKASKAS